MAEFMTGILSPIMAGDVDPDPDFADRESTIPDAPIGQSTRGEEDTPLRMRGEFSLSNRRHLIRVKSHPPWEFLSGLSPVKK